MGRFIASSTAGAQLFIILSLLVSLVSLPYLDFNSYSIALILTGYFLYGCLGIVVTYHRLLTHRSYKTHPIIEKMCSILGCLAGTGSPMAWVAIHINHHLKSDTPGDPHSPLHKGIKIFTLAYENEVDKNTKWRMRALVTNKFQQFLHRYYFLILLSWAVALYLINGLFLLVYLFLIPSFITAIMSNVVNYVGHKPSYLGGYRTFNIHDQSSNNWLMAIPSWGESWHNNHHRFPRRSYFGNKWYEIDIAGLVIKLISVK